MPVNWIDVTSLSFNVLLLLERVQLSWFPGWLPEADLAVALRANSAVEWYLRHKCPDLEPWLDKVIAREEQQPSAKEVRQAEEAILKAINDLVVYAVDPSIYDTQPFLRWDSRELTSLTDFTAKTVIDVGSGTGRLALTIAQKAAVVFAVEPVANLRYYLKKKARSSDMRNVYPVDGLITDIPFPDGFADITMGGHVFGDHPAEECGEMMRVTKRGGMVILCPGNNDKDNDVHKYLAFQKFEWACFEEPGDGMKRKYWRTI